MRAAIVNFQVIGTKDPLVSAATRSLAFDENLTRLRRGAAVSLIPGSISHIAGREHPAAHFADSWRSVAGTAVAKIAFVSQHARTAPTAILKNSRQHS